MIKEIKNLDDFSDAISKEKTGLIVIDFYTDWCGPCKMIAPKYAKLAEKYPNVTFYKLNAGDQNMEVIINACEISGLPTFCFFKNGTYINRLVGANDTQLENILLNNLSASKDDQQAKIELN